MTEQAAAARPAIRTTNELYLAGIPMTKVKTGSLFAALVLAAAIPYLVEDFTTFQFTMAIVYAIAILGLNLLTGFNGQFSLGHSAFFGIGAYTTAILMDQWGMPYYWTLIPSGVVCLVVGYLFGLPALRLEGLYLALATFALALAMPQLLKYDLFEHWTGGVQGIDLDKPESPISWMNDDQWLYYFSLTVMVLLFLAARNLVNSRTGRAIIAIRDNPISARTMGINTARYKSVTFGVSALYTGVGGSLSAIVIQFVAPDSFTFLLAVALLVGLVVGGLGSITGAIIGALFILFVPNYAEEVSKGLSGAVYGAFLIFAVYVMPKGAAGFVQLIISKLVKPAR